MSDLTNTFFIGILVIVSASGTDNGRAFINATLSPRPAGVPLFALEHEVLFAERRPALAKQTLLFVLCTLSPDISSPVVWL